MKYWIEMPLSFEVHAQNYDEAKKRAQEVFDRDVSIQDMEL